MTNIDKHILRYYNEEKFDKLQAYMKGLTIKQIEVCMEDRHQRSKDLVKIANALFKGLPNNSHDLRKAIFVLYLRFLMEAKLFTKCCTDIIGILILEVDSLCGRTLVHLSSVILTNIKNGAATQGKWLELFPQILSCLLKHDQIEYEADHMSGQNFKSDILNKLCSSKWHGHMVLNLAAMFKDITMTPDELQFVIEKILRLLNEIDLQELPPLIYQLLVLSTNGHRKIVLEGIISYFTLKDQQNVERDKEDDDLTEGDTHEHLQATQGTVILHVTFAIKQDPDLGKEFIKFLKNNQSGSPEQLLVSFPLSLALSVSKMHRFQEQIFDILKSTIMKSYQDQARQAECGWLSDMYEVKSDVGEKMLTTVENSHGWDQVTQGLVELGFTLMDSFGPKMVFGKVKVHDNNTPITPSQKACHLGAKLLLKTFKVHQIVHKEILDQILNRILIKTNIDVTHFLDLLSSITRSHPQAIIDNIAPLRDSLDYLSVLPLHTSDAFLSSLQPLLKISLTTRDALMLILRKAMFSRSLDGRMVAVKGFLMILRNFKIFGGGLLSSQLSSCGSQSFSLSQVDVHVTHSASSSEALCLDILGTLRRSLTQQADVRMALYQGLSEVLVINPSLQIPILTILLSQFKHYFEQQKDILPPLKLQTTIQRSGENIYLTEPMAHLLSTAVQSLLSSLQNQSNQSEDSLYDDNEQSQATIYQDQMKEILESLSERMISSELEDFELDKSSDFSTDNNVGIKNNIYAILVLGTYEVLMEYNFLLTECSPASCKKVVELHQNYHTLFTLLMDKATGKGKQGATAGKAKHNPTSMLTLNAITKMSATVLSESNRYDDNGVILLKENKALMTYIVNVAKQKVQQHIDKPQFKLRSSDDTFDNLCTVARVVFKYYVTDLHNTGITREAVDRQISGVCLECFTSLVKLMCTVYKKKLQDFMNELDQDSRDKSDNPTLDDLLQKFIKRLQRLFLSVLNTSDDDRSTRECIPLLACITHLVSCVNSGNQAVVECQNWMKKVTVEQTIEDCTIVKPLLTSLFELTYLVDNSSILMVHLAQDIHSRLGDIDQEVSVEQSNNFAIVSERTSAPTVLTLVLSHIDKQLDDTDWIICKTKAAMINNVDASESIISQCEGHERQCCSRLGMLVNALHEISQSAIPMGICADNTLKTVTHIYTVIMQLVKYFMWLYNSKNGHMLTRFEKLIKLTATKLTPHVYLLITYVQVTQSENLMQAADKGKKKGKSTVDKARVSKETKTIPSLIYSIEQYEKFLIQLSKKSEVDLMQHVKCSTSRDFRINVASMQAALEDKSDDSEDEENSIVQEDEPNNTIAIADSEPPLKKQKRNLASKKALKLRNK